MPIRLALHFFNETLHQFLLIVDAERHLLGTVTDGDIRRGILQGIGLDDPIERCMHRRPKVGKAAQPKSQAALLTGLPFLPLLDEQDRLVAVLLPTVMPGGISDAVVMAGGLGKRLGPLTEHTPKPLLPIAGKPILEHILGNLEGAGIGRIWLSVNHLADQFCSFIATRENSAEISLLQEPTKLGTAGSLSLLPEFSGEPLLVLNGDVLTQVDYRALDAFHRSHCYDATIAVAHHQVQVPFGVIRHDENGLLTGIDEKPVVKHFVAAGIYYLSPEVVALIPRGRRIDMPEILNEAHKVGMRLGLFPIHEYWTDVGRPEDLEAADEYHRTGK